MHDALPVYGGAERTLEAMLEIFPAAPVYTLVYVPEKLAGTPLGEADIRPSRLNRLPGIRQNHYRFFPLFPGAVRAFDLKSFDLIISSHYAFAHWITARPGQRHFSYIHTPLRYIWQDGDAAASRMPFPLRPLVRRVQENLRRADRRSAQKVDHFAANSRFIAGLVERAYHRSVEVIYPPVVVDRFGGQPAERAGFLCVSRLVRHKRIDVVVQAFNRLGLPLEIIGDGPEFFRLQSMAADNITFRGRVSDEEVTRSLARAQAFVHMAAEDFGIAIVEAQAAGCPVIAFNGGANRETVLEGVTGRLVPEQTPEALAYTVREFSASTQAFRTADLLAHAAGFSKQRFKEQFTRSVETLLAGPIDAG